MAFSQESLARSGLYRLLARLWLREVDGPLLHRLCAGARGEAFLGAGGVVPEPVGRETVETLAVDYCQLFLGPSRHFPPYQSVWQGGQFEGEACSSVRQFGEVVHYDGSSVAPGVMVDHLGVQLDLMGHALQEAAVEEVATDHVATDHVEQFAEAFFAAHLKWPEPLLAAAAERAQSDFYRSVVTITADFLRTEGAL